VVAEVEAGVEPGREKARERLLSGPSRLQLALVDETDGGDLSRAYLAQQLRGDGLTVLEVPEAGGGKVVEGDRDLPVGSRGRGRRGGQERQRGQCGALQ
jgi:hypothetical protein